METPITVIERHFHSEITELSSESVHALVALPFDRWHEFAIEYTRYAENFHSLNEGQFKKDQRELAPYLFEYLTFVGGLGRPSLVEKSTEVVRVNELISSLKRLLLYHHRVFLPDWFLWLLDSVRRPASDMDKRNLDLARLFNYLQVLVLTKPLFDAGVVNLIPTEALREAPIGTYLNMRDREWLEEVALDLQMPGYELSFRLNKLLAYQINAVDLGVDMIFPDAIYERMYRKAIERGLKHTKAAPYHTFHLLEKLPMPGLDHLALQDLVVLRHENEAFADWRDELTKIYALARKDEASLDEKPDEFLDEVAANLRGKRLAIMKGAETQGFWDSTKDGVATLGLGVIGLVAAEAVIPGGTLATNLLGTFIGGGTPLLAKYIKHKRSRSAREAQVRVYSVFETSIE